MKIILCFLFWLSISNPLFAQDTSLVDKAYRYVLNNGLSTAPEFVVVTIKNLNTGDSKEICTSVMSLFASLGREHASESDDSLTKYLFTKSNNRTFALKDTAALNDLNFYNYKLKNGNMIDSVIRVNHLRDSLKKMDKLKEIASNERDKYEDKRDTLLVAFADSITKIRPLTEEENQIIKDLNSINYEDNYKNTKLGYKKLSDNGLLFMVSWNKKVYKYKEKYLQLREEINRLYHKFFQTYYREYGDSFCHVAFNNGIITFLGDENPVVGYTCVID